MADNAQWINVDSFQTRVMQCFVNLTKANPTVYPALLLLNMNIMILL